jgi:hypothetical protein
MSASVTGNDSICLGDSSTLTASGGNSYLWSTGSTSPFIVVSPSETTQYSVLVTDSGCSDSIVFDVSVVTPIKIFFLLADDTVCLNAAPILLNTGFPSGGIYSGDGVVGNMFYPALAGVGSHEITYTYQNVCIASAQQEMVVEVCTGIENAIISPVTISVFPNPFSDEFFIQSACNLHDSQVTLTDALGRNIPLKGVSQINDHTISFSRGSFSAGVYWIIVRDKSSVTRLRMIKL